MSGASEAEHGQFTTISRPVYCRKTPLGRFHSSLSEHPTHTEEMSYKVLGMLLKLLRRNDTAPLGHDLLAHSNYVPYHVNSLGNMQRSLH